MEDHAILLLAAALFIALVVERLMEIAKAAYDLYEVRSNGHERWNQRARRAQRRLHDLIRAKETDGGFDLHVRIILKRLRAEGPGYEGATAISAEKLRISVVRNVIKAAGIVVGIVIAVVAGIDMFALVDRMLDPQPEAPSALRHWAGTIATGVAMGLGSAPLHKIIAALEKAKRRRLGET